MSTAVCAGVGPQVVSVAAPRRASIETMRVPARVERGDRFARFYYENGDAESICLRCFATVVPQRFQTLEDAERIHVCAEILKPWDSFIDL